MALPARPQLTPSRASTRRLCHCRSRAIASPQSPPRCTARRSTGAASARPGWCATGFCHGVLSLSQSHSLKHINTNARSCPLSSKVRLVAGDDAYLAQTHGGPRLFLNIEDYLVYAEGGSGAPNHDFQAVWGVLRGPVCKGRMHWCANAGGSVPCACRRRARALPVCAGARRGGQQAASSARPSTRARGVTLAARRGRWTRATR